MGLPSIDITFTELAQTVEKRAESGTVALILTGNANMNPVEYTAENDVSTALSADNKKQIGFALKGGETTPQKVICYFCEDAFANVGAALTYLENAKFDYIALGAAASEEVIDKVKTWIKEMRDDGKKVKAVLPKQDADDESIINYATDVAIVDEVEYPPELFCSRIAGLLAGTPLTMSCTYTVLPEVTDCTRARRKELDAMIDAGKLIIFNDGESVRIGRGVNSLTTITDTKGKQYKKIKIIHTMDTIVTDITATIRNQWIGKKANTYDNKCLLISAIEEYLKELIQREIIESQEVAIDIEANKEWLKENSIDVSSMDDETIKKANTGDHVFLKASIKMIDAIEDITIKFNV